ncbi:MAG: CopG family ribbon-helix-helix protein [Candidatus Kariarchaeaceae archaeon]|jgi:CopG family nickel-responsive transcriptional regulator
MPVISLSIEAELLKKFEKLIKREGYKSKSEAFRTAIHDFVLKYQLPEMNDDASVEMIVGFSYLDSLKIRNSLSKIQHEYLHEIKETLHRHIANNMCFELMVVGGVKKELQHLINSIRSTRGIESFTVSTFEESAVS